MANEGTIIRVTDYNNIRNKIVNILGVGSGSQGYGQPVRSSSVSVHSRVRVPQWDNLRFDIINIWKHQYGDIPTLPDVRNFNDPGGNNEGAVIRTSTTTAPYTRYDIVADQLISNRFAVALNQSITRNGSSPSDPWTRSRTVTWTAYLSCTVTVSWPSADAARFFFNSGGEIRFNSSRTGGSSTPQNTSWSTLLTSAGTKRFGAQLPSTGFTPLNGQNFYRLTSTPTVWTTDSASTPYGSNAYRISASTPNSAGQVSSITFLVEWIDDHVGQGGGPDSVDGTISLAVTTLEASGNLEPAGTGTFAVTSPTIILSNINSPSVTLNASFFTIGNLVGVNTPPTQFKATELIAQRDSAAGGTQIYSLALSSGLRRNTGLGTFFFAAPQGSWTDSNTSPVNFVLIGPHPSGTATLTVSRTGYPNQIITISVPANSAFSPYNFSRGFPEEFSQLTPTEVSYAEQAANSVYESISTPFTVTMPGLFTTWYGLGRRVDASGVAFWARFCTQQGITPQSQLFIDSFFNSVNAAGPGNVDYQASRLASKSFRPGTGYDKFEDRP